MNPAQTVDMDTERTLPELSKSHYLSSYNLFCDWKAHKNATKSSEGVMISYFTDIANKYKPTTLWAHYSMLKTSISHSENVNIESYSKLLAFLKDKSVGYTPKKSKIFTAENVKEFLTRAEDRHYLPTKVALIMGAVGSCRSKDLYNMKLSDIRDTGRALIVSRTNNRAKKKHTFIVTNNYYDICKRYMQGRSEGTNFFLFQQYRNGKFINQRIGINSFVAMGITIAQFLQLPEPKEYSGHSMTKSGAHLKDEDDIIAFQTCGAQAESYIKPEPIETPFEYVDANRYQPNPIDADTSDSLKASDEDSKSLIDSPSNEDEMDICDTKVVNYAQIVEVTPPVVSTPKTNPNAMPPRNEVEEQPLDYETDEFHLFAMNIAAQLRSMPLVSALAAEARIQQVVIEERLKPLGALGS